MFERKPLLVTSFSDRILKQSGKPLLDSYLQNENDLPFLIGLENITPTEVPQFKSFNFCDVFSSLFFKNWMRQHGDIVPVEFGGRSTHTCKCPGGPHISTSKKHKPRCPIAWFNYNAARWFRKIVTLRYAHEQAHKYSSIVWIDADCLFCGKITKEVVDSWFQNHDAFYLKNKRPVMETGVFGFNLLGNGSHLLEKLIHRYDSGIFRKEDRWDDSMQLQKTLLPNSKSIDLAKSVTGNSDVVENSVLKHHIIHDKGRHGRKLGIFK